jgi:DpnII restriction endonuclease
MTLSEKHYQTVINKNTFYFHNLEFQEQYESHIHALNQILLTLKNDIQNSGLRKEIFETLLLKENGLRALLALTGFSKESLMCLITVARVADNPSLSEILYKDQWAFAESGFDIKEWGEPKILSLLKENLFFRKGIVNLFFEGSTIPFLVQTMPLFELKKLSISKLSFDTPSLIDTIVRYKEKGSMSGKAENNPEHFIKTILTDLKIPFQKGDLDKLFKNEKVAKRTMDFILPSKAKPKLIIESSFLVTTSSGQGDKSKTEINIKALITRYYPQAKFIGFVDGIGWYVRQGDLRRIVGAFDDVFTFHKDEVERFKVLLQKVFKR